MIIQLGLYKRKPGISREEYRHLWTEVYGALNGRIPELSRHLRRYVQHVLTEKIAPYTRLFIDFEATRLSFSDAPVYQVGGAPALATLPGDCPC